MDLVLDWLIYDRNKPSQHWENINNVLKLIKGNNNIRFGISKRNVGSRIGVFIDKPPQLVETFIPSIDNLSLGESILLNMFINIVRHGEGSPEKSLSQIKGIVIIDEIDTHLHTILQYNVLPQLISTFPHVQFIITTHSPLFILGMKNKFGEDGFDIIDMPLGTKITTERFNEFENAYKIFTTTKQYEEDIQDKIKNANKPMIFLEGPSDIKYLEKACHLLDKTNILEKIDLIAVGGANNLNNAINVVKNMKKSALLIYDCDTKKTESIDGGVTIKTIPCKTRIYIHKGIENLFPDTTIKKIICGSPKLIDRCDGGLTRGEERPKTYSINKHEKMNLCNWICENGDADDFAEFIIVLNIIEEFITGGK
jgi:hypothetical protein